MSNYSDLTDEQLDIAIAERVYGTKDPYISLGEIVGWRGDPETLTVVNVHGKRPTLSAEAMLNLIEAMRKRGWWCQIKSPFTRGHNCTWFAGFTPLETTGWNGRPGFSANAATPQRAVCIAALIALDEEPK